MSEEPQSGTPGPQESASVNLFQEPAYAPGTPLPEMPEPTPVQRNRRNNYARPRRTDRRRTVA